MDQRQGNSVLRRKLASQALDPAPTAAGEARLLGRALARATSRIPGLVGSCSAPSRRMATIAELLELIESEAFVALIAAPEGETGLAILDPVAAAALIEALTIGRLARTPPPARRATPTDAQLLSDVIDATLTEWEAAAPAPCGGFRFQRLAGDCRLLELILDAPRFDLILQPLALLGDDVRRDGRFLLALPQIEAGEPEAPAQGRRLSRTARAGDWAHALETRVLAAPTRLTAVLGRVSMPLADAVGLAVGSRLVLPLSNLEEVELVALDGQILGRGRLGQFRAMRAVRLTRLAAPAADAQRGEDEAVCAPAPAQPAIEHIPAAPRD